MAKADLNEPHELKDWHKAVKNRKKDYQEKFNFKKGAFVAGLFSVAGGTLDNEEYGAKLYIPPGTLDTCDYQIWMKVITGELTDSENGKLLSVGPKIFLGPDGIKFNNPGVVISIDDFGVTAEADICTEIFEGADWKESNNLVVQKRGQLQCLVHHFSGLQFKWREPSGMNSRPLLVQLYQANDTNEYYICCCEKSAQQESKSNMSQFAQAIRPPKSLTYVNNKNKPLADIVVETTAEYYDNQTEFIKDLQLSQVKIGGSEMLAGSSYVVIPRPRIHTLDATKVKAKFSIKQQGLNCGKVELETPLTDIPLNEQTSMPHPIVATIDEQSFNMPIQRNSPSDDHLGAVGGQSNLHLPNVRADDYLGTMDDLRLDQLQLRQTDAPDDEQFGAVGGIRHKKIQLHPTDAPTNVRTEPFQGKGIRDIPKLQPCDQLFSPDTAHLRKKTCRLLDESGKANQLAIRLQLGNNNEMKSTKIFAFIESECSPDDRACTLNTLKDAFQEIGLPECANILSQHPLLNVANFPTDVTSGYSTQQ